MSSILNKLLAMVLFLAPLRIFASDAAPSWIENTLYGSGKMNTVLIVVLIILLGLAFWMFSMDRKLKHAEKEMTQLKQHGRK